MKSARKLLGSLAVSCLFLAALLPGTVQAQAPENGIVSRMADNPKGKGFGVHLDQGKVHVNFTSVWADDAIRMETERVLEPKTWHHIAVTYSGSRHLRVSWVGVSACVRFSTAPTIGFGDVAP